MREYEAAFSMPQAAIALEVKTTEGVKMAKGDVATATRVDILIRYIRGRQLHKQLIISLNDAAHLTPSFILPFICWWIEAPL